MAEPFERLRDRSDSYLAQHGTRPKVFLACLGRAADFNARASFAKSLFESGGIEAVEGKGDNLAKRFTKSGAKLACLCSSDKVYAREAAERGQSPRCFRRKSHLSCRQARRSREGLGRGRDWDIPLSRL